MSSGSLTQRARLQRQIAPAKLIEFTRMYNGDHEGVFCFVEGEDSKYYSVRLRMRFGVEAHFINSGGKTEVLRLFDLITNRKDYRKATLMFFLDRDFDSLQGNARIYETPCYSIENLYTSASAFSRILKHEFGLNELHDDYRTCMNLYVQRQCEFHQCTLLLNAWISCQRDAARIDPANVPILDLGDFDVGKFVSIGLGQVTQNYGLSTILAEFPGSVSISPEVLDAKTKAFSRVCHQEVFRGKFEAEFLRRFLELLKSEFRSKTSVVVQTNKRPKLQVSKGNFLSELSTHADTPPCLWRYLALVISARTDTVSQA